MDSSHLQRFTDAQKDSYEAALAEIKNGRKQGHWMWYIFPQVQGLGSSEASKYYGIRGLQEAAGFLKHPVLGGRLAHLCEALLGLETSNANQVFGSPDDLKLKSSMTLFSQVPGAGPVFKKVLQKFYKGQSDEATLRILRDINPL
jgi:uncharacterized protein (DUF1810 family)